MNNNSADYGGGIVFYESSSPAISHSNVNNNRAVLGGGIFSYLSSPTISDCTIARNSSSHEGGGIYSETSSPNISSCSVSENWSAISGGGIYVDTHSLSYPDPIRWDGLVSIVCGCWRLCCRHRLALPLKWDNRFQGLASVNLCFRWLPLRLYQSLLT